MTIAVRKTETPARPQRRRLDGVLLLDKAEGISSNHALQQVKRLFGAQKAGHTGTLDPFASGLLPICFGEATKFAGFGLEANKSYAATLQLGVTTDTGDRDGRELARRGVAVSDADIEQALAAFRGMFLQTPPMYSAINKEGRRLYEYAREGIEVEREQRAVTVHALSLRQRRGELLDIEVTCSKGTYIRTLAEQIGEQLGCGAHLQRLRRTASGGFEIVAAHTIEALQTLDAAARDAALLPPETLVAHLPSVELDTVQAHAVTQGRRVSWPERGAQWRGAAGAAVLLRAHVAQAFVGIVSWQSGELHAQRLMARAAVFA